jgi:xylose dehydrogenase (NAD/NADP)
MNKVNWGILGAARIVEKVLPILANSENGNLIAIGSRRENAAKSIINKISPELINKVQAFNGFDSVINHPKINAIYIPLANEDHTPTALKAIRSKKHVLIEKPMAIKTSDVELLLSEAKKYDVKMMEGFMYAFHPQFERLLDIIKSNILGEINYAHSMFSFPIQPARHYRINRPITSGGGALWDIGPYAIHTLRQCFKENPVHVYAQSKLNEHGADLSTTGMIDFGQNKRATFDISFECTRRSEVEVFGPSGRSKIPIIWHPEDQKAKIVYSTEKTGGHEEIVPMTNHFELEFKHFNESIIKNTYPKLTSEDALWNVKTLESLQKSIMEKKWISIF